MRNLDEYLEESAILAEGGFRRFVSQVKERTKCNPDRLEEARAIVLEVFAQIKNEINEAEGRKVFGSDYDELLGLAAHKK